MSATAAVHGIAPDCTTTLPGVPLANVTVRHRVPGPANSWVGSVFDNPVEESDAD
jgi:hypothetical protein